MGWAWGCPGTTFKVDEDSHLGLALAMLKLRPQD